MIAWFPTVKQIFTLSQEKPKKLCVKRYLQLTLYPSSHASAKNVIQKHSELLHLSKVNEEVKDTVTVSNTSSIMTYQIISWKIALWLLYRSIHYITYVEKVRKDEGERTSREEGCPFNPLSSPLSHRTKAPYTANLSSCPGPHSFQQACVDAYYEDTRESKVYWEYGKICPQWIKILVISANNGEMSVVEVHSNSIVCG